MIELCCSEKYDLNLFPLSLVFTTVPFIFFGNFGKKWFSLSKFCCFRFIISSISKEIYFNESKNVQLDCIRILAFARFQICCTFSICCPFSVPNKKLTLLYRESLTFRTHSLLIHNCIHRIFLKKENIDC